MAHWLDETRAQAEHVGRDGPAQALVIGDPLGRAARVIVSAGLDVVHLLQDVGVAAALRPECPDLPVTHGSLEWLPFPDATFSLVVIHDTLEHLAYDARAIAEAARVLRAGCPLVARVPAQSRIAWADAINLYRYVQQGSGRGPFPRETGVIGWRRHYGTNDVRDILSEDLFTKANVTSAGTGLTELAYAATLVATRWLIVSPLWSARARRVYARWGDADERLPGGASTTMIAWRKPGETLTTS